MIIFTIEDEVSNGRNLKLAIVVDKITSFSILVNGENGGGTLEVFTEGCQDPFIFTRNTTEELDELYQKIFLLVKEV